MRRSVESLSKFEYDNIVQNYNTDNSGTILSAPGEPIEYVTKI